MGRGSSLEPMQHAPLAGPHLLSNPTLATVSPGPSSQRSSSSFDHTYPPGNSLSALDSTHSLDNNTPWSVPVPSWLKGSSLKLFSSSSNRLSASSTQGTAHISEVYSAQHHTNPSRNVDHDYALVHGGPSEHSAADSAIEDKFRQTFAFDDKEVLIACTLIPVEVKQAVLNHYRCQILPDTCCVCSRWQGSFTFLQTSCVSDLRSRLSRHG